MQMPKKSEKKTYLTKNVARARLTIVTEKEGVDTEVVITVIEGQVPQTASTDTLNSAYKIAQTCEAAKKLGEMKSSSKEENSSSSNKKEIRETIVEIRDRVDRDMSWNDLSDRWAALQNKGSTEYLGEVMWRKVIICLL